MRFFIRTASFALLLAVAAAAHAENKPDVEARAKIVAPLVDEQTFFVARLDLGRIAIDALLSEKFSELLFDFDGGAQIKEQAAALRQRLLAAGVKDVYIVFTLAEGIRRPLPFAAIPLAAGSDEKAIRAALPMLAAERRGDVLLMAADRDTLARLAAMKPDARPELAAALEAAGDAAVQVLFLPPAYYRRVLEEVVGELPKQIGGGSIRVITRGMHWAAVGIDGPQHPALRITIQSADAQTAGALHDKLAGLLRLVGSSRNPATNHPDLAALAEALVPRVEGNRLVLTFDDQTRDADKLLASLAHPIELARRSAAMGQSVNNVRQIILAMMVYEDAMAANGTPAGRRSAHFPLPAVLSREGKPLLSWRVAILPYVEQKALYDQFHLDEPWDSPNNRPLIDKIPKIYRSPLSKNKEPGRTNYLLPVGNGAGFSADKPTTMKDITDGTANTIMLVEVDDDHAAIWTKPDDWQFDPDKPAQGLGNFYNGRFQVGFFDNHTTFLPISIDPKILKALFTRAGGEPIDPGSY
jgi:Protein of unknown function (DUF1559)